MERNTTSVGKDKLDGKTPENTSTSGLIQISGKEQLAERLATGRNRIYLDFLEWMGLSDEANIIILSPNNHYYYDNEELKEVKVLLNLKHLNHIKQVKDFLYTVNKALTYKSYFTGSFIDKKHQYSFFANSVYPGNNLQEGVDPVENGISSRIPLLNMIYDFIDSRTNNRNLTKKTVTMLLEVTGFKVLDMTEIDGITCFCAQKLTSS